MKNEGVKDFDAAIIGGGPAGLSAAMWCDELGLSAVLIEAATEPGGQLLWTYNPIANHLGADAANGRELSDSFLRQIRNRRFETHLGTTVESFDFQCRRLVLSNGMQLSARAVIVATGVGRRRLDVDGEDAFKGRGIIDSGKRDGLLARGKNAVIVGGGDAALENAMILSEFAERVTVVYRGGELRARNEFVEAARANPKVEILYDTFVTQIFGGERFEGVRVVNRFTSEEKVIDAGILLVRIGVEPNSRPFRGILTLDEAGYIVVDRSGATSVPGVYAAGDVANPFSPTVSTAVGMGATAAKSIFAWLNAA